MPNETEVQALRDRQVAGETLSAEELVTLNAGTQPETELTPEQLKTALADAQARIKSLNKESADRRKKLEALEKAELDKKNAELPELERAKAEQTRIASELDALKASNLALLLQAQFEKVVRTLKLEFSNENAQADAFRSLDRDTMGEDGAGMKDAVTALLKDRPYLFVKQAAQEIDARAKGRTNGNLTSDVLTAKRAEYGAL